MQEFCVLKKGVREDYCAKTDLYYHPYMYEWKNYFSEMKGDVGMKRRETRTCLHQDRKSLITPYLQLFFFLICIVLFFVYLTYNIRTNGNTFEIMCIYRNSY